MMLRKRIITALALSAVLSMVIFKLPLLYFVLFLTALFVLASWEWSGFLSGLSLNQRISYVMFMLVCLGLACQINLKTLLYLSVIGWFLVAIVLVTYNFNARVLLGSEPGSKRTILQGFAGVFVLVPCWISIYFARMLSPDYLILLLVLVYSADVGAYFVGRYWGVHRMSPIISPGKTLEGFVGGLFFAIGLASIYFYFYSSDWGVLHNVWFGIAMAVCLTFFGVLGDLFESWQKRLVGVKDSGWILPGHGGILDRIDSLTAASPVFSLILLLFHPSVS